MKKRDAAWSAPASKRRSRRLVRRRWSTSGPCGMRRKSKLADSWTRRELFRKLGKAAGASSLACLARILAGCGGGSTSAPPGGGYSRTGGRLLEGKEKARILSFFGKARPQKGQGEKTAPGP